MILSALSLIMIIIGCLAWYYQERNFNSIGVILSIMIILLGSSIFITNLDEIFIHFKFKYYPNNMQKGFLNWVFILSLIYIGTIFYTIAAYYHLKIKKWTFIQALIIAVPFLLIEYQFSLRGNFYAKNHLLLNAVEITLITMIFYFINSWLLNFFVLKDPLNWWREGIAFILILSAFLITTNKPRD